MGAAGNNGVGITGVAQDVRIMPLRVCSYFTDPTPSPEDDQGRSALSDRQIMAINYAGSHGARVANMSLGGTVVNTAVRDAFAHNPQTLFVISAGNDGPSHEADNDIIAALPLQLQPEHLWDRRRDRQHRLRRGHRSGRRARRLLRLGSQIRRPRGARHRDPQHLPERPRTSSATISRPMTSRPPGRTLGPRASAGQAPATAR